MEGTAFRYLLFSLCALLEAISAQSRIRLENARQTTSDDNFFASYRPFEFAFESNDGVGTTQHRRESGDASGSVKGSYGYIDPQGLFRNVEYIADQNGFRAVIRTNEPGTLNANAADAVYLVQPPPDTLTQQITQQVTTASPSPVPPLPPLISPATSSLFPFRIISRQRPTLVQYPATERPRYDTTLRPQVVPTGEASISRPIRIYRVIPRGENF